MSTDGDIQDQSAYQHPMRGSRHSGQPLRHSGLDPESTMAQVPSDVQEQSAYQHPMRLQKFLARAGVASRRGSENLMSAGRVSVNGTVVCELGSKVDPLSDEVSVDGVPVSLSNTHTYIMLNKPAGYLTTMDDPQGRHIVRELVPADEHPGLFPVGRLDMDTTGLLLFMTDGELAHALLHPRHHVKKCYHAVVDGVFSNDAADKLRAGVMLDDGPTQPAEVRILRVPSGSGAALADLDRHHLRYDKKLNTNERVAAAKGRLRPARSEVAITICEGRKREVKRMCRAVGHPVIELDRVSFGPLTLNGLSCGKWRALCSDEVRALKEACGLS